jgi:hypothetical protein
MGFTPDWQRSVLTGIAASPDVAVVVKYDLRKEFSVRRFEMVEIGPSRRSVSLATAPDCLLVYLDSTLRLRAACGIERRFNSRSHPSGEVRI